ncbi:indolepyruvate ferredoxin oxidoreductase family protein [Pseudemcibacter aquimaris]|uniref:indolepyruvate ferredoxin oxidoreductase family protein n=1 Tax=Pseudemcibacter aquimaris TaxID=2857064 RepID=UPI002010DA43|nr:indolepyruvate ferredoxin oxidoreductase family protein [Pseudemcibacter aquimaris]MCC3860515.1 indolepyruvate ferredoxin oxidoreductase family protein [Pseudemcibacter aquimaris]WDU59340.1 indolepyruvate ferredoxin oxidoreductase family protein [Pseudemcibacter aquimaris]
MGINVKLPDVSLNDKYELETGRAYMTAIQALVRIPLVQRWRDNAAGLNTGCFISGYRGSPLGHYDAALRKAEKYLRAENIFFEEGINEELGATAVWGTQQVNMYKGAQYDGVFGIWYGKGPGVDRSCDVLRHANAAGTTPHGGVLAIAGDDHACKSSTIPHQSDHSFYSTMLPMLYPANMQEFVEYGLLGIAMSRYSGCWTAFKVTSDTAESTGVVDLSRENRKILIPGDDEFEMPEGGVHIRPNDVWREQDYRLQRYKLFAALAFAKKNNIDRTVWDSTKPRFGIITSGKTYGDVRQALYELGIDEHVAEKIGLRLYKVGMPWPLEPEGVRNFCEGLEEILIVEEKRELIENQLKQQLFNWHADKRPKVVGKYDEHGQWLLPPENDLSVGLITHVIADRISHFYKGEMVEFARNYFNRREAMQAEYCSPLIRKPYFCSGCPHNSSTKVPEGSRATAGIGCHIMAMWMDRKTDTFTQMGGEGVPWIGQAPFTDEKHIFTNLGDGTYQHSGILAIRASIAARVNITYKILYNDAVAMTGGQPVEGGLTVEMIAQQMRGEGVEKIWILTEDMDRYINRGLIPADIPILPRDQMMAVQEEAREISGCSIIIYDQTCAAEKRRRRKRGSFPDPDRRVFINDAVCEGCGDCSVKSNCVSVEPLETEFGRKRIINQSSCNKDYSCVEGFCPSFVSVIGGDLKKPKVTGLDKLVADIPMPDVGTVETEYNILVTGVGGTGVLTIGGILGMAAHLDGLASNQLDQTGLAQKGGAVMSHVRLGKEIEILRTPHIMTGCTDLLVACDLVVAASPDAIECVRSDRTQAVINGHNSPVSAFVENNQIDFQQENLKRSVEAHTLDEARHYVEATELATVLLGDGIATNMFMMGYAWQKGLIPLSFDAINRAIELNGVAIGQNKMTFACGRMAAHDMDALMKFAAPYINVSFHDDISENADDVISKRYDNLIRYQDQNYADKYMGLINRVKQADNGDILDAVARSYFKLLAIKDEYEVARLYTNGEFLKKLNAQFDGNFKLKFHMAPPIFEKKNGRGEIQKREFGPWMMGVLKLVAKMKFLRGSLFDIFGYTQERKMERALITEYEEIVTKTLDRLNQSNYQQCLEILSVPLSYKGYGHVKEKNVANGKVRQEKLLKQLENPQDLKQAS